jgi:hypothetical protein
MVMLRTQIKPFYKFNRRKEFNGDAVRSVALLQHEWRLSAIRCGGDNVIVIFGVADVEVFRTGYIK